jgi:CheY-like chemotaxis protein
VIVDEHTRPTGRKRDTMVDDRAKESVTESPRTKVIVVEDSRMLQTGYRLIFRRNKNHSFEVIEAANGSEGIERLQEHPDCGLVILDINMPGMTGLELLRHCKRRGVFAKVPMIVISSEQRPEDIERAMAYGADAYLVKPFKVDELDDTIDILLPPMSQA